MVLRNNPWRVTGALVLVLALLLSGCQPIQPLPADAAPAEAAPAEAAPAEAAQEESLPADPFAGLWQGAIQVAGIELDILLTLASDDAGGYSATLDIPQQGASGLPVGNILVEGDKISFTILEGPQQATFSGARDGDAMQGAFSQGGQEGSFTLSRSPDEAAPEGSADEGAAGEGPAPQSATGIDSVYTNLAGTFSVPIPTNWTVDEQGGIVTLTGPENDIFVNILSVPTEDLQAAIDTAWAQVDSAFDLEIDQTVEVPATAGYDEIVVNTYDTGDDERIVQAAGLLFNGASWVMIYDLTLEAAQRRSAQISIVDSGFKVLAMEETTLDPDAMGALTPELIAEWESFIQETMETFEVPGALVGVVQGGEIVYSNAFGVADMTTQAPMTTDMQMMIGSTGKSLTTLMMATLVDDGLMTWDTPAQELFEDFAVMDPALSESITMRNLVCACTGVPRRDLEFIFNWSELDAADVVASLADFEFFTDFGEAFQYSNQMVATAGYISGHVARPDIEPLFDAYTAALAERVTDPIGMENTTLSFDDVRARDTYATPHGVLLQGGYTPIPLAYEESLLPIAPAGGHWSTLEDMAKYMVMQLSTGVAPDGTQVVSEENLLVTRVPQVQISADASYGLGWIVSTWRGLPMIEHGGNTLGFTSDFAFLPTADTGIVILANAQGANTFSNAARMWLINRLFDVENEIDAMVDFTRTQMDDAQAKLNERLAVELDVAAVEPFVGLWSNPALGGLELLLEDGRLIADVGEFRTTLLPRVDDEGNPDGFLLADPPLPGFALRLEMEGESPTVVLGEGLTEYIFTPAE